MAFINVPVGVSRHIATSSVLNPTLLLALICSPLSLWLASKSEDALRYLFFVVGVAPIAVGLWQIVKFTNGDPDRLQNDKHVENKMLIGLFGDKASGKPKEILIPHSGELIDNPEIESDKA